MQQKPQLLMDASVEGGPIIYRCSLCAQTFLPPKDLASKDAAMELWASFKRHLQEKHPEEAAR